MQCRACEHHLIDKARFCDDCGIATTALELDADGLMSYCGKCLGLLRGTKKYCIYCGEPSPHSPKYKKRREASWIEQMLVDPRVQMGIVGIMLLIAALPAVSPIRYRTTSSAPFVEVVWEQPEEPKPTRVRMPRRDAFSIEPLLDEGSRPDGLNIASASGVTRDSLGNLYISDAATHRVFKISAAGERSIFAGVGTAGFSGDGGAAQSAELNAPGGLAVDSDDNLYIADTGNNRIRRVTSGGIIKTIAGKDPNGAAATSSVARFADADKATLLSPASVQPDRDGNLFITESACRTGERKPTVWVLKQKM